MLPPCLTKIYATREKRVQNGASNASQLTRAIKEWKKATGRDVRRINKI